MSSICSLISHFYQLYKRLFSFGFCYLGFEVSSAFFAKKWFAYKLILMLLVDYCLSNLVVK